MAQAIISAVAALLGALVGGSATLLGGWWQHKRQVSTDLQKQIRTREEETALKCDKLLLEIARTLPDLQERILGGDLEEQQRPRDLISSARQEIRSNISYLPNSIRARIDLLLDILDEAQRIAVEHYHTEPQIIRNSCMHGREVLITLLRYENLPRLPDEIVEYDEALATIGRESEVEYSDVTSAMDDARAEFLEAHPDAKKRIKKQGRRTTLS